MFNLPTIRIGDAELPGAFPGKIIDASTWADRGFARADAGLRADSGRIVRVFCHGTTLVEVTGTHDNPVLTDTPVKRGDRPRLFDGGDRQTQILAKVGRNEKGITAISWGIVPDPDAIGDWAKATNLSGYVGGRCYSRNVWAEGAHRELDATILELSFEDGLIKITLQERWGKDFYPAERELYFDPRFSHVTKYPDGVVRLELSQLSDRNHVTLYLRQT